MKLRAKIKKKYLDEILNGRKITEWRQIESIVLYDGEREVEFEVDEVHSHSPDTQYFKKILTWVQEAYDDIEWKDDLPLINIFIGKVIRKEGG